MGHAPAAETKGNAHDHLSTAGRQMPPGYLARLSDCERLSIFEEAAFHLASGQQRIQIRHGEYWVQYGQGSITYLTREITRLRLLCGGKAYHAISVGRRPLRINDVAPACRPFNGVGPWR